jgi:hypothetical protein
VIGTPGFPRDTYAFRTGILRDSYAWLRLLRQSLIDHLRDTVRAPTYYILTKPLIIGTKTVQPRLFTD